MIGVGEHVASVMQSEDLDKLNSSGPSLHLPSKLDNQALVGQPLVQVEQPKIKTAPQSQHAESPPR